MVAKKNEGKEVDAAVSIVFHVRNRSRARLSLRGLLLLLRLRTSVHAAPRWLSKL